MPAPKTNWVEFSTRWLVYVLIILTAAIMGFNYKADWALAEKVDVNKKECTLADIAIVERIHQLDKAKVDECKMDARFQVFSDDIKSYVKESEGRIVKRLDRIEEKMP